jgi:hypothetical protein
MTGKPDGWELPEDEQLIHLKGLLRQMKCQYAEFILVSGKSYVYDGRKVSPTV